MATCIYSKEPFASSNGEHILQNFLGARWASQEIVKDEIQSEFGRTIDAALEKSLRPIRNLLGTEGGRGGAGPPLKTIPVTSGEVIDLEPGGKPRLARPIVQVNPTGTNQYQIHIKIGTIEQLGWALALVREKIPGLKVDTEMMKNLAQSAQMFLAGQVKLDISLGGKDYFRALLKSCFNLLGVKNPNVALSAACDSTRAFVKDGAGPIEDFARWIPEPHTLSVPKMGRADHFVAIMTTRGGIEGLVQLFGHIRHSIRIASKYEGPDFSYGYIVNPFRDTTPAESRTPKFETSAIPSFNEQLIRPCELIWATFRKGIGSIMGLYLSQSIVTDAINEILRPHEGELFTEELAHALSKRLTERFSESLKGWQKMPSQ